MAGTPLTLAAPAKLNLTLEVLRRRDDGYHDIKSVMQRITLADDLRIEPATGVRLACNRRELEGPENLVWRAAALLRDETGCSTGAQLTLTKRIPVAAGLGGGSSDAATALRGLNEFWSLSLSRARLLTLAAQLGSDVPFFLADTPAALAEGRGERLTPLLALAQLVSRRETFVVLVKPEVGISAGAVYRAFTRDRWTDGRQTDLWLEEAQRNAKLPAPFNSMEPVALQVEPAAAVARDLLRRAGALSPVMAGSGSTFFALFEQREDAERVAAEVRQAGGNEVHLAQLAAH